MRVVNLDVVSLSDAQGYAEVDGSPQIAAIGGGTRLTAFWKRATGTQSDNIVPTITDAGDHVCFVFTLWQGCKTTGVPWNVTSGGSAATSDTSLSVPGATTTVDNCRVVVAPADHGDTTASRWTNWANPNLSTLTVRADGGTTVGHGGGLAVVEGGKATAGAYGATTATLNYPGYTAYMTIALAPE